MGSQEDEDCIRNSPVDKGIHVVDQSLNQIVNERSRKKKGNFSKEEDIILVSAWLETSIDVVNGNDQKSATFWKRISTLYSEKIGSNYPKRTEVSISNRWYTLQDKVNKFQGCYAQIETKNPLGTTEKDMEKNELSCRRNVCKISEQINEAKLLYQSTHGSIFAFDHCWNILRTQPKWMTRNSLSSKKRMYSSCPRIQDSIDLEDNSSTDKSFGNVESPLGKKAEKDSLKKRKGKNNEGHILENWKEYKIEMHESKLKMQAEKMKIFSIESEKNVKIEQDKIALENKRLDFEAKKFFVESENNAKIEKSKIDLENKRLDLEAKRFSFDSEMNAKIEKGKIDIKNKEIELDAKKFRHQQMQQEMNIVLMDTSTLNEKQRNFIEARKEEILAKKYEL